MSHEFQFDAVVLLGAKPYRALPWPLDRVNPFRLIARRQAHTVSLGFQRDKGSQWSVEQQPIDIQTDRVVVQPDGGAFEFGWTCTLSVTAQSAATARATINDLFGDGLPPLVEDDETFVDATLASTDEMRTLIVTGINGRAESEGVVAARREPEEKSDE